MHINKHFLFIVGAPALLVLVIIVVGIYRYNIHNGMDADIGAGEAMGIDEGRNSTSHETLNPNANVTNGNVADEGFGQRVGTPTTTTQAGTGKLKVANFSGKLEKVNTSCFSDGECYVVVAGKHVTAVRGWSQEIVGATLGVEGFGDLQKHIGETIEVYAKDNADGTYTLYGSEGFYVKLVGGSASIGGTKGEPNPGTPTATVGKGCMLGGCSAQLCVGQGTSASTVTTCEYKESYACYQTATCEKQQSGQCGWTQTPKLSQCLISTESGEKPQVQ